MSAVRSVEIDLEISCPNATTISNFISALNSALNTDGWDISNSPYFYTKTFSTSTSTDSIINDFCTTITNNYISGQSLDVEITSYSNTYVWNY